MKIILFLLVLLTSVNNARLGAEDLYCTESCICPSHHDTGSLSLGIDWLYWKVQQSNMSIGSLIHATTNTFDPNIDWDPYFDGIPLDFSFKSSNGYRVYADYDFCRCDWTLSAAYTHIPTSTSVAHQQAHGLNNPFDGTFVALAVNKFLFLSSLPSTLVTNVRAKWSAKLNYFDLDIARNITFDDCFQLSPHLGLRILQIDQRYTMAGNDENSMTTFTGNIQQDLTGYGLEGGLWGLYKLPYNLFIKGHIGGAILYSKFNTKIHFLSTHPIVDGNALENGIVDSKSTLHEPVYDVDFSVALGYEIPLDRFLTNIQISWEQHKLFNTNQFAFPSGDLYMQGLTLGINISY